MGAKEVKKVILKLLGYYSLLIVIFTLGAGLWPYETSKVTFETDWITQAISIAMYIPVLAYLILSLKAIKSEKSKNRAEKQA